MQAMVLFPKVQTQAQAELDRVVGPNRLPTFEDYERLPYIRALIKEVLRWRGVPPLGTQYFNVYGKLDLIHPTSGVPHRLRQDDWYDGYWIPKDTLCIVSTW